MDFKENGKFAKGNQVGSKKLPISGELKIMQTATKEEIILCAHGLTRPWKTLAQETKEDNASRLAYVTANAVNRHNHKFICWLLEMAVGKAKQEVEFGETNLEKIQKLIIKMNEEAKPVSVPAEAIPAEAVKKEK